MLGTRLLNLKIYLASSGQSASYKSIFGLLQQSIRPGSEETKLQTEDQVQKLVSMVVKASDAGLSNTIKSCQVIDGVRTWVGRWSVITRVFLACNGTKSQTALNQVNPKHPLPRTSSLKTTEQFQYVFSLICQACCCLAS